MSTGLAQTNSGLSSLSTTTAAGLSNLSTSISTVGQQVSSLSTSTAGQVGSLSTGLAGATSSITSLSTGLSTAQGTANTALGLAQNSAQYGSNGQSLQLNSNGGVGTTISNVRAGQAAGDAVNVGQMQQADQNTLNFANNFTNQQVAALQTLMNQAFSNGLCSFSSGNVTCGPDAKTNGQGATAIGNGSVANGDNTTALGAGAQAHFAGSVAIGAGAKALADPTTAVGNNAVAQGNNSVALGANTLASGDNAVALGQGSLAERANTVSVGNAQTGLNRQITNVAPGVTATDAVNLGQMQGAVAAMGQDARNYAAKGIASSLAIPSVPVLAPGKNWVGAAVGTYGGQSALGVAWGYQVNANVNMGLGVATSSGNNSRPAARAQVGYSW